MEPVVIGNATLYLGDCRDILPTLDKVDAVVTDPPYGTTACKWDVVVPFEDMWRGMLSAASDNATFVFTASQPFTSKLVCSNINMFRHSWVWSKGKAANFPQVKRHPLKVHEDIVVFGRPDHSYTPQMTEGKVRTKGGYFTSNKDVAVSSGAPKKVCGLYYPKSILDFSIANNKSAGLHPTQKPVSLMEYLVSTYSRASNRILDPFMGSGTTGVAAVQMGRDFIGIEREPKYFDIACKRIEDAQRQGDMFI